MGNTAPRRLFLEEGLRELQGPDRDGDLLRPASFAITPIWYRYNFSKKSWQWTPEERKDIWMDVSNLVVSSGQYQGQTPAPPNVLIINTLHRINPKPMVHYALESKHFLDRGSFGQVYSFNLTMHGIATAKAFKLIHTDKCAVKLFEIAEDQVSNLTREVQSLSLATNIYFENIVFYWGATYVNIGRNQIEVSLVMEYCDSNVRRLVSQLTQPMDHELLHVLIQDMLKALQFLHDRKITHRDLKPENILYCFVGGKYVFKLCDFGLARIGSTFRHQTSISCTAGYAPPEYLQAGTVSSKSDVFALGVVLYEACSPNKRPFEDCPTHFMSVRPEDLPTPLPPGSRISTSARRLVEQCLIKNMNDRPYAKELFVEYMDAFCVL